MVLIKQMDMPDCCENCELSDMSICLVTRQIIRRMPNRGRTDWCPLTEVQETLHPKITKIEVGYREI